MKRFFILTSISFLFLSTSLIAQNDEGQIHGSLQFDAQTYMDDSIIGAIPADEIMLSNIYANFTYTKGNFSAGTRFEGYLNGKQGFLPENEGVGFPYAYVNFKADNLDVTVGSFYEQFGSGLIFRAWEDKSLGYDNAMNGILLKYKIGNGIYLKGIYGQQRLVQTIVNERAQLILGEGIVRGIDVEISLNEMIESLSEKKTLIIVGGSFVSKYQPDNNDEYYLPENVGSGAGRVDISRGRINLMAEYVYKTQDPSASGTDNSNGTVGQTFIYKNGQGAFVTGTYSMKGLGVSLMAKSIDNMNFRSDRMAKLGDLNINYIPDVTKNHTYAFAAFYPYATQPNGEAGLSGEVFYKLKKKSALGGKYGANISLSFSRMFSLIKEQYDDETSLIFNEGTMGYKTSLLAFGDELFYQDISLEITKKFNRKIKGNITLQSLEYDNSILHSAAPNEPPDGLPIEEIIEEEDYIKALTAIADISYKFTSKKSLRAELQHLSTEENKGSWGSVLLEYSIPHWFFILSDQYNYGNYYDSKRIHYYKAAVVYTNKANRFLIGYGRQREGVECIGGVCRKVLAANGLMVSITSSF